MDNIADLRKSYERAELSEDASHADPLQQFGQWLDEAIQSKVPEPNAMTLATVGSDLRPSTRVVLIKGFDARGIVWYTNYESRKGQELAGNPYAALQFHWVELERVVRIEGWWKRSAPRKAMPTSTPAHWTRALAPGPRPQSTGDHGAHACWSPMPRVTPRSSCCSRHARRTGAATACGPTSWQFWQGRKSRLHDRLRYTLQDGGALAARTPGALSPAPR
jgi:pyridoxamine 5'-phosphate oxidase